MNWFKKFFMKFGKIFKSAAKTTIGQMADQILPTVLPIVKKLENDDMKGWQKAEVVSQAVRQVHDGIGSVAINLAINLALAVVREGIGAMKK